MILFSWSQGRARGAAIVIVLVFVTTMRRRAIWESGGTQSPLLNAVRLQKRKRIGRDIPDYEIGHNDQEQRLGEGRWQRELYLVRPPASSG
jgi:hypothetical protein